LRGGDNVPRKPQEITVNLTVKYVPNPNPERGIDLLARIILEQILKDEANKGMKAEKAIV
jgi:hypothetical protein